MHSAAAVSKARRFFSGLQSLEIFRSYQKNEKVGRNTNKIKQEIRWIRVQVRQSQCCYIHASLSQSWASVFPFSLFPLTLGETLFTGSPEPSAILHPFWAAATMPLQRPECHSQKCSTSEFHLHCIKVYKLHIWRNGTHSGSIISSKDSAQETFPVAKPLSKERSNIQTHFLEMSRFHAHLALNNKKAINIGCCSESSTLFKGPTSRNSSGTLLMKIDMWGFKKSKPSMSTM